MKINAFISLTHLIIAKTLQFWYPTYTGFTNYELILIYELYA